MYCREVAGQSSTEFLILAAGIFLTATSLFFWSLETNEVTAVIQAAYDGTENVLATIETKYQCSAYVENLKLNDNCIEISIVIIATPPENIDWLDFKENVVKKMVREGALNYIQKTFNSLPSTTFPIKTAFGNYDISVSLREVTR